MEKYTLIITEKPDAAARIANALDITGKAQKSLINGVPYFLAQRNAVIVVVPALGHLYTVTGKSKGSKYPVFDFQWVPRYLAERGASRIRGWLKAITKLAENGEVFINACDYDLEGSIIGYCILKYACGGKEQIAKRMKYSTLTKEELQESYAHLLPHLDFALVESGLTRHEIDWLYGINLSRALTIAAKNYSGQYAALSTGRVQGPTLKFLEKREKTIKCFVPTPYWNITAKISINDTVFEATYEKTIANKAEAEAIENDCKVKQGKVEKTATHQFLHNPPFPFDLGALQSEAYRLFKYPPTRTSSIAQQLYLSALISYPRTSSQKLPPAISYETILKKLSKLPQYARVASELLGKPVLKPNEGGKIDPAHPAIYPTGNLPDNPLDSAGRNIFDLVVKRFMAVFGESAKRERVTATININEKIFHMEGAQTLNEGWMQFYKPYIQLKEKNLPPLNKGETISVIHVGSKQNFTMLPPRYNPRTLLRKMEKEEIGTKATRAGIIKTLYDRSYIHGTQSILVTDLGFEVTEVLAKYCPSVISPELTRKLEDKMEQIQQKTETHQSALQSAIQILDPVLKELKEKEIEIGRHLSEAIKKSKLQERIVGSCPVCDEGKLVILTSKKSGKRFIGCTNYFEGKCKAAFPLPQKGTVKRSGRTCKRCGWPTLMAWSGKRPWMLCFNPDCPLKKEGKR